MRVLHILDYEGPQGGLYQFLIDLREGLASRGVEQLYCARQKTPYPLDASLVSLRVPTLGEGGIGAVLDDTRPDLVHFHEYLDNDEMALCLSKYPCVRTVHDNCLSCPKGGTDTSYCPSDPLYQEPDRPRTMWSSLCKRHCDVTDDDIAVHQRKVELTRKMLTTYFSDDIARSLRLLGFSDRRMLKIPTLLTPPVSVPERDPSTILFAGRIVEQKGVEDLVRSLALLDDIPWKLVLAGTGERPFVARLVRLGVRLGLADKLIFTGHLPHDAFMERLRRARVFVFPSIGSEGYGYTGAEAMMSGVPIVAFDVGGIREWLRDGYNGFVVPPRDIDAMAEAIRRILTDEAVDKRFRANALEWSQTFNIDTQLAAIYEMYCRAARGDS